MLQDQQWLFSAVTLVVMAGASCTSYATWSDSLDGFILTLIIAEVWAPYHRMSSWFCGGYVSPRLYQLYFQCCYAILTVG